MTGPGPAAGLVHGMGKELVEPDWAPLTGGEVGAVLARYGLPAGHGLVASGTGQAATPRTGTVVAWSSPRPMSAAGLVRHGTGTVFVKRHHVRVRSAAQLAAEHAFAAHLRASGLPVPAVRRTAAGRTVVADGDFVYEVHEVAAGIDLYRDAMSWTPYLSPGHARAAGAALARLHRAAAGFTRAARPPAVLTSSCCVITAADPLAEVDAIAHRRPGLARYLAGRDWRRDLARDHLPVIRRAAPLLAGREPRWGHGDWHPSNLTWDSAGPDAQVVGVFDLGLANRTFAVHDLAVALERSVIAWLDLTESGAATVDTRRLGRAARWLRRGPPAEPGRGPGPARGAPGRSPRVRAVGDRVLRRRGGLARARRSRLRHLPHRPHPLVRGPGRRGVPRSSPPAGALTRLRRRRPAAGPAGGPRSA